MSSGPADALPLSDTLKMDSELDSQDVGFFDGQKRKLDELLAESILDSSTDQLLTDFDKLAPNYEMKVGNVSPVALAALETKLEEERVERLRKLQNEYKLTLEQIKEAGQKNIQLLKEDTERKKKFIANEIRELEVAHRKSLADIEKASARFESDLVEELHTQKEKTFLFPKYQMLKIFQLPEKHVYNLAIVLKSFRYPGLRLPKGDYSIAVSVMEGVGRTNRNIIKTCKVTKVFSHAPPLSGFEDGSPSMDFDLGKPLIVQIPDTPTASLLVELILIGREIDYRDSLERENLQSGENNITMRCSCVGWGIFPLISLGKNAKLIRGLFSIPLIRGEADLKLSSYREFQTRLFSISKGSPVLNQTAFLGNMILQTGICESNDSDIELPRLIEPGSEDGGEKKPNSKLGFDVGKQVLGSLSPLGVTGPSTQAPKDSHILDVASSYIPLPKDVLEPQITRTFNYLKSALINPCFVNNKSLEVFLILLIVLLNYCVSNMSHYAFEIMSLSISKIHYNCTVSPVHGWIKYNQDLLTTLGNMGITIVGPIGVLVVNILLAVISVGFGAVSKRHKNAYKVRTLYFITLSMFVLSLADPILTAVRDALVNVISPQYRTSFEVLRTGRNPEEVFIPIIVYIIYEILVLLLFYVYINYFHNNGELGDVTERVSGKVSGFVFPFNDEVSLYELYQAATSAQQYRGPSGERRKILVIEGENNVNSFTYFGIYNISVSGVRRVYRQFIRENGRFREIHKVDPAIMEIVRKVERSANEESNQNRGKTRKDKNKEKKN